MKPWERIILRSAIILFLLSAIGVGLISYYFGVEVITEGEAYGFTIGESRVAANSKADKMLKEGRITAIHIAPDLYSDNRWALIVNPRWWNNKITLDFEGDNLIEIRRDRICCELP